MPKVFQSTCAGWSPSARRARPGCRSVSLRAELEAEVRGVVLLDADLGDVRIVPELALRRSRLSGRQLLELGQALLAGERPAAARRGRDRPLDRPPRSAPPSRRTGASPSTVLPSMAERRAMTTGTDSIRSAPRARSSAFDARPLLGLDVDQEGGRGVAGTSAASARPSRRSTSASRPPPGRRGRGRRWRSTVAGPGPGEGGEAVAQRGQAAHASRGAAGAPPGDEPAPAPAGRGRGARHAAGEAAPRTSERACSDGHHRARPRRAAATVATSAPAMGRRAARPRGAARAPAARGARRPAAAGEQHGDADAQGEAAQRAPAAGRAISAAGTRSGKSAGSGELDGDPGGEPGEAAGERRAGAVWPR